MQKVRRAGWFFTLAFAMACWMGVLGSIRGEAVAAMIASRGAEAGAAEAREADLAKVQLLLERKIVTQKLQDFGVSPEEALAKVRAMNDRDVHHLASLADRAGEGADDGLGLLIGLAILVILIIVIVKLMNKEIVVR